MLREAELSSFAAASGAGTERGQLPPALLPGGAVLPDKTDDTKKSTGATRNILVIKV